MSVGSHNDLFGVNAFVVIDSRNITVSFMYLVLHYCSELSCLADMHALVPRMTKFCMPDTPAISKPRTTVTATADLTGFPNGAALGAKKTYGRCRDWWNWNVDTQGEIV